MRSAVKALTVFALLISLAISYFNLSGKTKVSNTMQVSIEVSTESKEVMVNGKKITTNERPYLDGSGIMIPLKEVILALEGAYVFDKSSGTVTIDYNLTKINLYIGSDYVFIENTKKTLKTSPILRNEDVFVSDQFFTDILGFTQDKNKTRVRLTKEFVAFGNSNITNFVSETLNKQKDYFTPEELQQITVINLNNKGITSLEGIQYFTNAKILELKGNQITDIKALKALKNLTELNLSDNLISDTRPLSSCTNLTTINLSQNLIENTAGIHLLRDLKRLSLQKNRLGGSKLDLPESLEMLDLSNNDISTTECMDILPNLKVLVLNNNPVMNIDNLEKFSSLNAVYLWGYSSSQAIQNDINIIKDKCTNILSKLNLDKTTEYEKALKLYNSVLYNTGYISNTDKNDNDYKVNSRPSTVFTMGKGNSSALSQLIHILLNMKGIKCYTYDGYLEQSGNKIYHTWNVLCMGKKFYYSDIGLAHILGLEGYGHAFFDVSESQFLSTHPKGILQQFSCNTDNSLINQSSPKGWTTHKDYLYDNFTSYIIQSGVEKKLTLLTKDKAMYIVSDDKFIYYRNEDDGGKLYRIDIDGNNKIKLNDDQPIYPYSDSKYIYYINNGTDSNLQKNTICRYTKKDGKKEIISKNTDATWMAVKGDYIFHKSITKGEQEPGLYVMDTDGDNEKPLVDDTLPLNKASNTTSDTYCKEDVFLYGDVIFYTNSKDSNKIYSVKTNGKFRKKLTDGNGKILEVVDDYIYYKEDNGFFMIMKDGTGKVPLNTDAYR